MKKSGNHARRSMCLTIALLLLILLASWGTTRKINALAERQCFAELYSETNALGREIEQSVAASTQQLELIASVAADYDDLTSQELWQKLDDYSMSGTLSRFEILLPNDTVITQSGKTVDVSGQMSFAEIAALGEHISGRETDLTGDGSDIARHYVSIVRGGETVAVLYGVVRLADMPEHLVNSPYNGEAAAYVIDDETGDFLMDTWHSELGNIWEFGSRTMAPGYNNEQLKQGIEDGESNYVVFVSKTTGSYLYFYYTPLGVEHWSVALSVPEDVVFENTHTVQSILNVFLIVEILCFVVYLAGMLLYARRETRAKQRELDTLSRIYEIEKLLFNAHEDSDRVDTALQRVAELAGAEQASLWMITQPGYDVSFLWQKPGSTIEFSDFAKQKETAYRLMEYFKESGKDSFRARAADLRRLIPESEGCGINDLLAIPVAANTDEICGILTMFNCCEKKTDDTLLRSVALSFGMLCRNMRGYYSVKEQSEKDLLTGLYNRNRYEIDAARCRTWHKKSLACLYADANGLHELNNTQGHAAGDKMLQTVASVLAAKFGAEHTYRIGGDEFLTFAADQAQADTLALARTAAEEIDKAGYHIAIGVQWAENVKELAPLVKAAEQKMYAAKRAYYAKHDRRART